MGCGDSETETPEIWASGDVEYDFGPIHVDRDGTELNHTFILANVSNVPVEIDEVVGSCGCIEATCDPVVVQPGADFAVSVRMSVANAGAKRERVHVLASDRAPVEVRLFAESVVDAQSYGFPNYVALAPATPATVTLAAVYNAPQFEGLPPVPVLACPDGVHAEVGPWVRITPSGYDTQIRWHASIVFRTDRPMAPYELARATIDGVRGERIFAFVSPIEQ